MTIEMQDSFRHLSEERGLWAGASVATHQDLSGLFLIRAVEFYLKPGGRFSFVMPLAALSRRQFAGLRSGDYKTASGELAIAFARPWDLHQIKPNLFRVPPSVINGTRAALPLPLASDAESWSGHLPGRNISWQLAAAHISRTATAIEVAQDAAVSPYHTRFTQGATLVPRFLLMVEDAPASPIGVASGRREVRSLRTANEKPPWKYLPALQGSIEQEFIRPVHLGATLLPFRLLDPWLGVIPADGATLLEGIDPRIDLYPGLAEWWTHAEAVWDADKGENRLSLLEQVDFRNKLSLHFPLPKNRVLYTGSGQYLAAARLDDVRAVIEHALYWATASSLQEAQYLTAILNSDAITKLAAPLQARGEHNPRHFDKLVWRLPIPLFDPGNEQHRELIDLAACAEAVAAAVDVGSHRSFQAQRRLIRHELDRQGVAAASDALVLNLLAGR